MKKIDLKSFETNPNDILAILRSGEVIVFPSDTVYGLLADAQNPKAVEKLLQFKERPPGKAVSVFCSSIKMIEKVAELSTKNKQMLEKLLPGCFTIALPSKHILDTKLESEKETLGVRIPDYLPVINLVNAYGSPLTATSANLSGDAPHYSIESLFNTLSEKKKSLLGAVVDAGKLPRNKPSTVIDLSEKEVTVLRVGDTLLKEDQTVVTKSETETKTLAQHLVDNYQKSTKPVVFILKGDLGSGKTVFTKGIADHFAIEDVVSPTFVISYEYDISNDETFKKLIHFDLYNIQDEEEFKHLGIKKMLEQGNLLVFEWGEKLGPVFDSFKEKAEVVFIELEHRSATERQLVIHTL